MDIDTAAPSSTPDTHAALIKSQLPAWLTRAPANLRSALRASLLNSNQSRYWLQEVFNRIQSPQAFALPLLERAMRREYLTLLDAKTSILVRQWQTSHLLGLVRTDAGTTEHTLLEAALQNFEASEAEDDGMGAGSVLVNVVAGGRLATVFSPTQFAGFCRKLDMGGSYLRHVREVIRSSEAVRAKFRKHEQYRFEVALHQAYLKDDLPLRLYEKLVALARDGHHPDLTCSHLTLNAIVIPTVLVIQKTNADARPLLYTPEDPIAAFRQHTSMQDLQTQMARRLLSPAYQNFFKHLVPLHNRESLLAVKPARVDWMSGGSPGKVWPPRLEHPVTLTGITDPLFHAIALQRFDQIERDACEVAVPTAQADLISRQKRLQYYLDMGKSLLFFAASFVPVVGEVMLVVAGAQLVGTVYSGFAAWSRGDSQAALEDLLDVVDNIAMAVATAGVIKAGRFTAGLVKVQVRNQGWRLWHSDLEPYRHPQALPEHLVADKQGVYQHEKQHFLKMDDHVHAIKRSADGKQWALAHPTDPLGYSPPLLSNGVGGWRHVHETPQDWDTLKLIKRLGPDAAAIKPPAVETLLLLSGVDSATLRQAHQDMVRPPPLLRDTVKHFNLEQEITDFNLDRAQGSTVTAHSPLIQFHLLRSLPQWPDSYTLKVVDDQQNTLMSTGTALREIRVSEAEFRRGDLLHAVQKQMEQVDFNQLLPASFSDYLTKIESLALRLQEQALQKKQWLFSQLNAVNEKALTPAGQSLHALMPELSESHLEELEATLTPSERQHLQAGQGLPTVQRGEAEQYNDAIRATRMQESVFLKSLRSRESVPLTLYALERVPGWPDAHRIEVYDESPQGPLLGGISTKDASARHVLIRHGELYSLHTAEGGAPTSMTSLPAAIDGTLSAPERSMLLEQSGAHTLEQALQQTGPSLLAQEPPPCRGQIPTAGLPRANGIALDPLFAETASISGLSARADDIYQGPPMADGRYRYYIQDNQKFYPVKHDPPGWRLLDARSRFRAYQPYLRRKAEGGWEIDPAKEGLLGGAGDPDPSPEDMESSEEFESAHSTSPYGSAEEGAVQAQFTRQERAHMRTQRGYQHSQNYRGFYDRANNGRYPLRNEFGKPMRIKQIQAQATSLTSSTVYTSQPLRPYLEWEGYENVAQLYEDKLEVVPFTAAHQKSGQESSLIGQATVVTRRPLTKGAALGVYGGEILPLFVARARRDPYLMPIKGVRPTTPYALNTQWVLSGDNALSRINTIFEYDAAGQPIRQAPSGYNVEAVQFRVAVHTDSNPSDQMILTGLFASEDIPAGTELRWNYQYDEATIRKLFSRQ